MTTSSNPLPSPPAPPALPTPSRRSAAAGWAWITESWKLFRQEPGLWIAMWLVWFVVTAVANLLPLGGLVASVFFPVFLAGFMAAASHVEQGQRLDFNDLFLGFKTHLGNLAGIGVMFVVGSILSLILAIVLILLVTGLDPLVHVFSGDSASDSSLSALSSAFGIVIALLFLILVFSVPVLMGLMFAPALVMEAGGDAWPAVVASFRACWINVVPMTVYGLVLGGLGIACLPTFGLGLLLLGPLTTLSLYTAYRDIFHSS